MAKTERRRKAQQERQSRPSHSEPETETETDEPMLPYENLVEEVFGPHIQRRREAYARRAVGCPAMHHAFPYRLALECLADRNGLRSRGDAAVHLLDGPLQFLGIGYHKASSLY